MGKLKVLHYYTQYNLGGTEKVIYSILAGLNKERFECYFISSKRGTNDNELKNANIKTFIIDSDNKFENRLYNVFKKYKFDIIHVHNCSEMNKVLRVAKKAKIKKRIAHSHVSRIGFVKIGYILKVIKSLPTEYYANEYYACSNAAAKWLFPTKFKKSLIILNPVNKNNFMYDEKERKKIRHELGFVETDYVLIMVSRLSSEKNHMFILDVLKKLLLTNQNYKLLIIGDGPEKDILEKKIKEKEMTNNIIMLGSQSNVRQYLSASDLFLMPSKHEGLGIAAIEAQFNGMKTICSSNTPTEVDINEDLVNFLDLNSDDWTKNIEIICSRSLGHKKNIRTTKFDNDCIIKEIERNYEKI